MSWQKCPICNGEGQVSNCNTTSSLFKVCPVCKGARIISEIHGLPPGNFGPTLKELEDENEKIKEAKKQAEIKSILERTEELTKKNKP